MLAQLKHELCFVSTEFDLQISTIDGEKKGNNQEHCLLQCESPRHPLGMQVVWVSGFGSGDNVL